MAKREMPGEEDLQAWERVEGLRDRLGVPRTLPPLEDPKEPDDFAGDKVGAGRYILSFIMAGLIGVWIAYWARYYGYRAIWINLAIFVVLVIIYTAAVPAE